MVECKSNVKVLRIKCCHVARQEVNLKQMRTTRGKTNSNTPNACEQKQLSCVNVKLLKLNNLAFHCFPYAGRLFSCKYFTVQLTEKSIRHQQKKTNAGTFHLNCKIWWKKLEKMMGNRAAGLVNSSTLLFTIHLLNITRRKSLIKIRSHACPKVCQT